MASSSRLEAVLKPKHYVKNNQVPSPLLFRLLLHEERIRCITLKPRTMKAVIQIMGMIILMLLACLADNLMWSPELAVKPWHSIATSSSSNLNTMGKQVWYEVYGFVDNDIAKGTQTLESFDTIEEAEKFCNGNPSLYIDQWSMGVDGIAKRVF